MKLYVYNENCVLAGNIDYAYDDEELYEIQTLECNTWASDTIGDNKPRTYAECMADVDMFLFGACGPEFEELFSDKRQWRIRTTGDTLCDGDHTEFSGTESELIAEAREYLREHSGNSWRCRAYRNILDHLRAEVA